MMDQPLHADLSDGFEPQTRARSNTWPLPRPDNFVDMIKEEPEDDLMKSPCGGGMGTSMCVGPGLPGVGLPAAAAAAAAKKNSSRRNAWGNLSYADLITQAITTAPDKRLTLSQIYEWMVHNVPYFKDKGDSNSSAGWKNSIRHNLSLHNRFMRVQNEGTGKSSWWMINPDAKPGKSARRRATSMETSKFEKRRGRVKKKVEALRNGLIAADATPSPCSSVSEGLDLFPDSPIHSTGFQLSPDFRPRASSNASSCGRLSPIPAVEHDWSSPYYSAEQLAGNLEQGMKLHQDMYAGYSSQHTAPPPPYQPPYETAFGGATAGGRLSYGAVPSQGPTCPVHRLQGCSCALRRCGTDGLSPGSNMSPTYAQSEPSPDGRSGQPQPPTQPQPYQGQQPASPSDLPGPAATAVQGPGSAGSGSSGSSAGTPIAATTMMGQLMGALNPTILDDLNLNIETLPGGFDCNVDEVIKQELSLEGSLDFNFGQHNQQAHLQPLQQVTSLTFLSFQGMGGVPQGATQHGGSSVGPQAVPPYTSVSSGHSWVH